MRPLGASPAEGNALAGPLEGARRVRDPEVRTAPDEPLPLARAPASRPGRRGREVVQRAATVDSRLHANFVWAFATGARYWESRRWLAGRLLW